MPAPKLLAMTLTAAFAASARAQWSLERTRGSAAVLPAGKRAWEQPAELPRPLVPQDALRTGGRSALLVRSKAGSAIELGPRSTLRYETSLLGDEFALERGVLRAVCPGGCLSSLLVRAPAAALLSQGGEFDLAVDARRRATLEVRTGSVLVRTPSGEWLASGPGPRVTLAPGRSPAPGPGLTLLSPRPDASAPADGAPPPGILAGPPAPTVSVEPSAVPRALADLESSPDDSRLRATLDTAVRRAAAQAAAKEEALAGPLEASERARVVDDARYSLIERVEDDAVRESFLRGQEAFAAGQYLLAADRLALCRLLGPAEPWLRAAVDEYLAERIPRAVGAASARRSASSAGRYRAAYAAIASSDWRAAARDLSVLREGVLRSLLWDRQPPAERAEVEELEARARARAAIVAEPEDRRETRVADALRGTGVPEEEARDIEDLLAGFSERSREAWWQRAAEGLRRAYLARALESSIRRAEAAAKEGRLTEAFQTLVGVLQKSPGDARALALLQSLEERSKAPRQSPRPRPVPSRVAAAAIVQAPAVVPAAASPPSLVDSARAEAGYLRGLGFYIKGDVRRALDEWRRALEFDPSHSRMKKAYDRAVRESGERSS